MITSIYLPTFMAELENTPSTTPEQPKPTNDQVQESINKFKSITQKLNKSEKMHAIGALLVIVCSFLPAYTYSTPYYQYSQNNLFSSIGWLNFLAAIAVFVLVILPQLNVKLPPMPMPLSTIFMIAAGIAAACSIIQLLSYVFDGIAAGSPSLGIFLVLVGSLLMAYTAYNDYKSHAPTQTPPAAPTSTSGESSQS
ncbi:MAG: hypothetical protein HY817_05650 [Candidatus Abawacabacteria bacterium]|nr:hypothetical protein [Candidatus Abawacabacteria bacterium]